MLPNRVVAVATAVISLALAVLPVAANMDWRSTAGIIAGIAALLTVANRWLIGWQAHEQNTAWAIQSSVIPPEPDQGDSGSPTKA